MEAIQSANGIDDPQYLRVGQALIIPALEDTPEPLSAGPVSGNYILPTPTPLPLTTAGEALYYTPVGGVWAMGEVLNTSGGPVSNLQLRITLLDVAGNLLASNQVLAAADYLQPEARAPFALLFVQAPPGVTDMDVAFVRAEAIGGVTAGFVPLPISGATGAISGPQYRVSGQVANDTGGNVALVSVVATLYAGDGRVMGYRKVVLAEETPLSAGAGLNFDILLTPQGNEPPAAFKVIAWGTRVQ